MGRAGGLLGRLRNLGGTTYAADARSIAGEAIAAPAVGLSQHGVTWSEKTPDSDLILLIDFVKDMGQGKQQIHHADEILRSFHQWLGERHENAGSLVTGSASRADNQTREFDKDPVAKQPGKMLMIQAVVVVVGLMAVVGLTYIPGPHACDGYKDTAVNQ